MLPEHPYEEWQESGRATLRANYLTRLVRTAQLYEELHVALVRVLALTGQRRQALDHVVRLVRALRQELGTDFQPATRELALAIRDRRARSALAAAGPGTPAAYPSRIAPDGRLRLLTHD